MALLALALVAIVVFSFIGAALSSRARSEKKSIASFHQQMDQLSGVVKSDSNQSDALPEAQDLFSSVRSHVKVVGKASSSRASGAARRRTHRSGTASTGAARRTRPSLSSPAPASASFDPPKADELSHHERANQRAESYAGADRANSVSRKRSSNSRRTRTSSSTRSNVSGVHTTVLHFDDEPPAGAAAGSPDSESPISVRRANTKVLAAASVVALAGLGTIVFALSNSHGPVQSKLSVSNSTKNTTAPRSPTPTTVASPPPVGPLTPTSADSAGATYFIDASSITVNLSASAPSWVEESVAPGSKVLWQGIIPAGGSKSFTLDSSMWIRTGNVDVLTITANGRTVSFNANPGVYDFTFRQGVKA